MKKSVKVILILLAILLVATGAVVIWQWDNLQAVALSLRHSREDLSQMRTDTRKQVEEAAQSIEGVTVRDLTEEEQQALASNALTREEIIERITGKAPSSTEPKTEENAASSDAPVNGAPASQVAEAAPATEPSNTVAAAEFPDPAASATQALEATASSEPTLEDQLATCLAEIYVMKSEYTLWLEELFAAAIDEYSALPPEKQTESAKYNIFLRCMEEALDKEDECDARMAELETQITTILTQMGRDLSLVDEIEAAYKEEKEITKAYYLGLNS